MEKTKQHYEIIVVIKGRRRTITCKGLNAFIVMAQQLTRDGYTYAWNMI